MAKVFFGRAKVQKLRRIAIDANALENLGISEGDEVCVYLDTDKAELVVCKHDPKKKLTQKPLQRKTT
jgi:bifunctional DNA-binding transcriptional regulator/antitoxin component of YhaV-PrlF toxin-antitoxin module